MFGWHNVEEKLAAVEAFEKHLVENQGYLDKETLDKIPGLTGLTSGRLGDSVKSILKAQKEMGVKAPVILDDRVSRERIVLVRSDQIDLPKSTFLGYNKLMKAFLLKVSNYFTEKLFVDTKLNTPPQHEADPLDILIKLYPNTAKQIDVLISRTNIKADQKYVTKLASLQRVFLNEMKASKGSDGSYFYNAFRFAAKEVNYGFDLLQELGGKEILKVFNLDERDRFEVKYQMPTKFALYNILCELANASSKDEMSVTMFKLQSFVNHIRSSLLASVKNKAAAKAKEQGKSAADIKQRKNEATISADDEVPVFTALVSKVKTIGRFPWKKLREMVKQLTESHEASSSLSEVYSALSSGHQAAICPILGLIDSDDERLLKNNDNKKVYIPKIDWNPEKEQWVAVDKVELEQLKLFVLAVPEEPHNEASYTEAEDFLGRCSQIVKDSFEKAEPDWKDCTEHSQFCELLDVKYKELSQLREIDALEGADQHQKDLATLELFQTQLIYKKLLYNIEKTRLPDSNQNSPTFFRTPEGRLSPEIITDELLTYVQACIDNDGKPEVDISTLIDRPEDLSDETLKDVYSKLKNYVERFESPQTAPAAKSSE